MRVDFMIIGAQKSGTTSLAEQLAAHPEICFSSIKEPGYFNTTADWQAGLDSYHALFAPVQGQLCGEASTMYTFLPETPDTCAHVYDYNPELKLIYIMRDPVKRVVSHYGHNYVRGLERRPAEEAVTADPRYINRSRYGVQIRPYLELFGSENVLLLVFEEYIRDQLGTLRQVARFLGISEQEFEVADTSVRHKTVGVPYLKSSRVESLTQSSAFQSIRDYVPESIRHTVRYRLLSNKLEEAPEFSPELEALVWRFVVDDVETVEKLMGRNIFAWRNEVPA